MKPYAQEPLTDFSLEKNKIAFQDALKKVENECGKDYPIVIGGEKIFTEEKIVAKSSKQK